MACTAPVNRTALAEADPLAAAMAGASPSLDDVECLPRLEASAAAHLRPKPELHRDLHVQQQVLSDERRPWHAAEARPWQLQRAARGPPAMVEARLDPSKRAPLPPLLVLWQELPWPARRAVPEAGQPCAARREAWPSPSSEP